MPQETIKARINKKTGIIEWETKNFNGDSCDVTKALEAALGTIESTEDTEERYNYIQPDYLPNTLVG